MVMSILTMWNYIQDFKTKNIAIIAHKSGKDCEMIFEERFKDRVFTIALLDSMRVIYWKDKVEKYLPKRIIYKCKFIIVIKPARRKDFI
ncbi:uncharacterized protein LOC116844390 isoform X4 [Odontomachus brunneus]|uniref:uncharacterized protein LOC116844390 isoform X4 n=1 Tax=Odontomachus brunneus TaxID=486640 RepID=UPI0013F2469E|nr:uncharacterized protein LOC116844390 isoform X4 [Odontomachus brunneus]